MTHPKQDVGPTTGCAAAGAADEAGAIAALASELSDALAAIDPASLPEAQRAHLHRARAVAGRIGQKMAAQTAGGVAAGGVAAGGIAADGVAAGGRAPAGLVIDRARFDRLLELAGAEGAQELLQRLIEDLRQVDRGLQRGLAEHDPAEIRAQTHVLIALAGAVGATALQRLGEALNDAAHRMARDEVGRLGEAVLGQLALLNRFVADQEAAGRAPA